MYGEAKLAFFIYLWYPKTKVSTFTCSCFIFWVIFAYYYLITFNSFAGFIPGNSICLWFFLQTSGFRTREWNWSQFVGTKDQSWWYGGSILAESYQLWSDKNLWCSAIYCISIKSTYPCSGTSLCSVFLFISVRIIMHHVVWFMKLLLVLQ